MSNSMTKAVIGILAKILVQDYELGSSIMKTV